MSSDAMLLTLQILMSAECFKTLVAVATTPHAIESDSQDHDTSPDLDNLLAPPSYVNCVYIPLMMSFNYAMVSPKSTAGGFFERYSVPGSRGGLFLVLATILLGIASISWVFLVQSERRHLTFVALVVMWGATLPFYLMLGRRWPPLRTAFDLLFVTLRDMSVRLYFTWMTGAVLFGLLDEVQYLYGDYFSFAIYAQLMGGMLAMSLGAYLHGRDPVVAVMATWFIVGLANRKGNFDGETKETFERLQTAATVVKSVFLLALIIDAIRCLRFFLQDF